MVAMQIPVTEGQRVEIGLHIAPGVSEKLGGLHVILEYESIEPPAVRGVGDIDLIRQEDLWFSPMKGYARIVVLPNEAEASLWKGATLDAKYDYDLPSREGPLKKYVYNIRSRMQKTDDYGLGHCDLRKFMKSMQKLDGHPLHGQLSVLRNHITERKIPVKVVFEFDDKCCNSVSRVDVREGFLAHKSRSRSPRGRSRATADGW